MLSRERAEFGSGYGDSGLLFCWEDGRPVHPDTITSRFRKIVQSAGLPKINLHDVRHSYASAGRDAKIDWKALSERIGHSDVAFTMRQYVQTDLEVHRQAATALAELILGGVGLLRVPRRREGVAQIRQAESRSRAQIRAHPGTDEPRSNYSEALTC